MDTPEQEAAKAAAMAFIAALGDPGVSDHDAAWQGVMALMAAGKVPGLITDPVKFVARCGRLAGLNPPCKARP